MKINKLTLISTFKENGRTYCVCECECGNKKNIEMSHFKSGHTKSCGCLSKQKARENGFNNRKYNTEDKDLYNRWRCIKSRCSEKSDKKERYFNRGIKVCDLWVNNFNNFKEWALSSGWNKNLTIERIDNNKGYCPENCEWVDRKKQARNRNTTKYIPYKGKLISVAELVEILNKPYSTVYANIDLYIDKEKA